MLLHNLVEQVSEYGHRLDLAVPEQAIPCLLQADEAICRTTLKARQIDPTFNLSPFYRTMGVIRIGFNLYDQDLALYRLLTTERVPWGKFSLTLLEAVCLVEISDLLWFSDERRVTEELHYFVSEIRPRYRKAVRAVFNADTVAAVEVPF